MTVIKATPQYEPAYRQSRFFSGGSCMRAQNMVRTPMDQKSPSTASTRRKNDPFLGTRSDAVPLNQIPPREPSAFTPAPENAKSP
jgi:hypothetical protein